MKFNKWLYFLAGMFFAFGIVFLNKQLAINLPFNNSEINGVELAKERGIQESLQGITQLKKQAPKKPTTKNPDLQEAISEDDLAVETMALVDLETGSLVESTSSSALKDDDFRKILRGLSEAQDSLSLEKNIMLSDELNLISELAQYSPESSCGKGVCGILIPYVELQQIESINDLILANNFISEQLGASMSRLYERDNGYGEVRIIINQDNSEAGKAVVLDLSFSVQ